MEAFNRAVGVAGDVEIHVTQLARRVAFLDAGKRDDLHIFLPRGFDGGDDIGRSARAANRDQQIAALSVPADGCREGLVVAEIVAECGQAGDIVESHRTNAGVFAAVQ